METVDMDRFLQEFSEIGCDFSTSVELLGYRARHQPNCLAFTFLPDGETEGDRLTYAELDRQARAIAAKLQALGLSGERALLLYPSGLDYLAAFFGCLYAEVVAVPAYPPHNQRNTPRIQAVVADARAAIALTTTTMLSKVRSLLTEKNRSGEFTVVGYGQLRSRHRRELARTLNPHDTLAFLQYTSGSTGTPKGVMLTHGNLLHNAAMTYRVMGHSPTSKFVSWLPTYHDMGLIGGILQPLYGGFPCILMPPAAFLQRPYRWLQAISRYNGTTSGAPNFAYELCIDKIAPEQVQTLDLSSWSVAFNGAEPIRADTLERFWAKFAACGFRKQAFYPCYGMAETTLMVSGGLKTAPPVFKTIQKDALECDQVVEGDWEDNENACTLVGCGQTLPELQIVIAHPEMLTRCLPSQVGEIWVSGPSVGCGYWNRPEDTEQTFRAYLSDTGEGPFLRTGDLGFLPRW
jgi:acyl-CoA synthetase (AMP-forming)/AMP-acid ligase II